MRKRLKSYGMSNGMCYLGVLPATAVVLKGSLHDVFWRLAEGATSANMFAFWSKEPLVVTKF